MFDSSLSAYVTDAVGVACRRLSEILGRSTKALPLSIVRASDGRSVPSDWAFSDLRSLHRRVLLVKAGSLFTEAIVVVGPSEFVADAYARYGYLEPIEWVVVETSEPSDGEMPPAMAKFFYEVLHGYEGFTIGCIWDFYQNALRSALRRRHMPVGVKAVKCPFTVSRLDLTKLVDYVSSSI